MIAVHFSYDYHCIVKCFEKEVKLLYNSTGNASLSVLNNTYKVHLTLQWEMMPLLSPGMNKLPAALTIESKKVAVNGEIELLAAAFVPINLFQSGTA